MSQEKCGCGTAPYTVPQFTEVLKAVAGALPKGLEGTNPKEVIRAVQNRGEALGIALSRAISEILDNPPVGHFFMTVRLGMYKSTAELKQAFLANGKKISDCAGQILDKVRISPDKIELDLYEVSVAELGFTSATSRASIYSRAFKYGFQKCPGEVGPLARIQCADKKRRLIGMDPVADADGDPYVFRLYGDCDNLWLYAYCDYPGNLWDPDHVWVFVWPRRK